MTNKKQFGAFAFMGPRGGITLKRRYKTSHHKGHDDFKVSFNGGKPIHIKKFKNRWAMFEAFANPITKAQAKEAICDSFFN